MNGLSAELDAALRAMEASFHVRVISTFAPDVVCAPADAPAADWLAENNPEFDQFPVKEDTATIGVLLRQEHPPGKVVRDVMHPLCEGLIVSADMPIADLVPQLRESHYRLVLRGGRIDGLVTQSDLLKLPVRMLIFGLISHLEMCLRELVRRREPWPKWLEALDKDRRRDLDSKLNRLKEERLEPDPLEVTNFSDVVRVLTRQPDLDADFNSEMDQIRELRNEVAHARTYISCLDDLPRFMNRFAFLRDWIRNVSTLLETNP